MAVNKNPAVASFRNVTRPTQPLWPVTDGDMHWSLISAMNLNYLCRQGDTDPICGPSTCRALTIRSGPTVTPETDAIENWKPNLLTGCLKAYRFAG
ncbi:MAG: type VI secretion system baseplate subunit TssF [Escherichia sp.]